MVKITDITPILYIPSFSETPGGILNSSTDGITIISANNMIQPTEDTNVGGMQPGATSLQQGSGNDIFKISLDGIHLGSADFADAPFSVDMQGNLKANKGTFGGELATPSGIIGGWTINATTLSASTLILDAGNQKIESTNYVSGIAGSGFHIDSNLLEVGNISARGLIRTATFQKDTVSTVGGNLMVLDGDILDEDMTSLD
jgi:hypothetical protein